VAVVSLTEVAADRLRALRAFDPLLDDWVHQQVLCDGEADLVLLAAEATQHHQPLRITLPGGSSQLAAALAAHTAVRQLSLPGRYPSGPTVLLAGARERQTLLELSVSGEPLASGLGAARLRADGRVQRLAPSRTERLTDDHRLVLVSPRARWPQLDQVLGVAVLDESSLRHAFEDAHRWAIEHAELVHVVATLDPGRSPVSYEVTWPQVVADTARWGRRHAWPAVGDISVDSAGAGADGLADARQRIANAPMSEPWPAPLAGAAALTRALASLSVPMSLYDLHTARSIAVPFAARIEDLEETGPADLPGRWAGFAATDWAPLKRRLLDAAAAVEDHNPKAEAVGTTVERLLEGGHRVDIWVDSQVHSRALQEHLLTGGFAVTAEQFACGDVAVRPYGDAHRPLGEHRAAVLTGLPASWHLPHLLSGAVGGPLTVVAYYFEAARVPAFFGWMLNNANRLRHAERQRTSRAALGGSIADDPVPTPIELSIDVAEANLSGAATPSERMGDAAEFAALADDEWLSLVIQARERTSVDSGAQVPARAFLVEPGPAVLIVSPHALLDRLVAGRLRPTPARSVLPGMQLLTATHASGGVFAAIRARLDHARGLGTRFWLSQWDEALNAALAATGSPSALAAALMRHGAIITAGAVASWPSPYRIGPRDAANIARVATVADHVIAGHHHQRIHAVMRGVRAEHAQLGRQLAGAVRAHLNGDAEAFDRLDDRYGADIEALLGEPAIHVISQHLADGHAPKSALGRVHAVADAQSIFEPEEPT
jgi:hypothetical protein